MNELRRRYINATYDLLIHEGFENVTIRKIAHAVGCNSAILYRNFKDLNSLIAIASIRFLQPYYDALGTLIASNPSPLETAIQGWECFAFYAFQNVPVFNNLFFGDGVSTIGAAREYAEEFPEEQKDIPDFLHPYIPMSDLWERDYFSLMRIAEYGAIAKSSVEYLADCDILFLRGMFQQYGCRQLDDEAVAQATGKYMNLIYKAYRRELLPGYHILTDSPEERGTFR